MAESFIILKRDLFSSRWATEPLVNYLYIYCIQKANYTEKYWKGTTIKRGQFVTSFETMSKETGMSVSQLRTALKKLCGSNLLVRSSGNKYTVITVNNYDSLQNSEDNEDGFFVPEGCNQMTDKSTSNDNQIATTNKDNKENKDNKDNKAKQAAPARECERAAQLYHENCPSLPKVSSFNKSRRRAVKKAADVLNGDFEGYFKRVGESDFLTGVGRDWRASFDWLLRPDNIVRVLEGNYDNHPPEPPRKSSYDIAELDRFETLDWIT